MECNRRRAMSDAFYGKIEVPRQALLKATIITKKDLTSVIDACSQLPS